MSVTLVSREPCWGLPGLDGDGCPVTYHYEGGREAALQDAVDRLKHWDDALPIAPTQEAHLCWQAECDGCGWEHDEDDAGPGAHISGDLCGPGKGALDGSLFEQPDGTLLCRICNLEALASAELPSSHPKMQCAGQGELIPMEAS